MDNSLKISFALRASIALVASVFMLSACGSGGRADEEFEGKYISVSGEALGITLTGEDISGFSLDLKSGGKGSMTVYGESESIEWTNDDENLTIDISGTEMVGKKKRIKTCLVHGHQNL